MFDNLQDQLQEVFDDLRGKGRLTEGDISAAMRRVRMALLEADVSFKVVKPFITHCTERCMQADVLESLIPSSILPRTSNRMSSCSSAFKVPVRLLRLQSSHIC